ncbi:hypothetical protein LNP74_27855 [Klebsiella pneumoniae subsp. pneumoniae]|nr:hypothetical protein [Klebsiella pneumoniae subsp. pneumoniae]
MRFRSDNPAAARSGMTIHAWAGRKRSAQDLLLDRRLYCRRRALGKENANELQVPYPFKSAQEMLAYCKELACRSGMVMQNSWLCTAKEIEDYFANVWQTMRACIDRGMNTEGVLPGPLCAYRVAPRRCVVCWWPAISSQRSNERC